MFSLFVVFFFTEFMGGGRSLGLNERRKVRKKQIFNMKKTSQVEPNEKRKQILVHLVN